MNGNATSPVKRWVDFENDYKTLDLPYMESVMWAFKTLHNKGLIYEVTAFWLIAGVVKHLSAIPKRAWTMFIVTAKILP